MEENIKYPRLYEAREAAEYLSQKWGRPYTPEALKKLRQRKGLKPMLMGRKSSFWTQAELDAIEAPERGRKKRTNEDDRGENRQVMLVRSSIHSRPTTNKGLSLDIMKAFATNEP